MKLELIDTRSSMNPIKTNNSNAKVIIIKLLKTHYKEKILKKKKMTFTTHYLQRKADENYNRLPMETRKMREY